LPGKPDEAGSKRQLDLIKFEEVLQSGDPDYTIADAAKGLRAGSGSLARYTPAVDLSSTPMSRLGSSLSRRADGAVLAGNS